MNSIVRLSDPSSKMPGLYEPWPGDPGPQADQPPPFPIKVGERFLFGGTIFTHSRRTTDGTFVFDAENAATPILRSSWRLLAEFNAGIVVRVERGVRARPSRAHEAAANGLVSPAKLHEVLSEEFAVATILNRLRDEQKRRTQAGLPLLPLVGPRDKGKRSEPTENPTNLDEFSAKVWSELGFPLETRPHWKTIGRKRKETEHLEVVSAIHLIDGRKIAEQPARTDSTRREIIREVIGGQFATRTFESVAGAERAVNDRLEDLNKERPDNARLEYVGRCAIENQIITFPGIELCAAKEGKKKAALKYRVTGKLERPEEPGTLVEFDWHQIDLENKWPKTYEYLSELAGVAIPRLWLSAGICVATGGLYGYSWSVGSVARGDVMRAFAHMIRQKPSYAHLGVKGTWLHHGLMKILAFDHGDANLARDVLRAVTTLGVEIAIDEKGNPQKRPHIERYFGIVEEMFISKLVGALGRNTIVRPESSSEVGELLAIDELDRRFIKFNVDGHAVNVPSTRWMSPNAAWRHYEKMHPGWAPDTARSAAELDQELRISVHRRARNEGIRVKYVFYNDDNIKKIRSDAHAHSNGDPKVEARIKPEDISDAIVHDPHPITGGWKQVECCFRGYAPGKSMALHNIILNAAKIAKKAEQEINEALLNNTFTAVTARAREKAMKRGASRRSVGGAARIAQLRGPGGADLMHGAPPHPRAERSPIYSEHQAHIAPTRSEGIGELEEAFDPARARSLLLRKHSAPPAPVETGPLIQIASLGTARVDPPQVDVDEDDDNDDAY
ncbi:hypothetical protein HZZ13_05555 [Bradyrhizobium sp. CNPSo 4010]|uniref:Integrase catalytic domain-containing protein n=1 Tax=Bradyrhizobium agreste TaxID=2751811 RepID=A0ABS0PJ81_9BRAD|nr:hypothetical protein [Bradyrhizobium agreste]MBH5397259.1 hypothetical protein [Bradyrhizobium agreste]